RTDAEPGKHAVVWLSGGRVQQLCYRKWPLLCLQRLRWFYLGADALMASSDSSLSGRLAQLRHRFDQACSQAGRPADAVALLPGSTTVPVRVLAQALDLGLSRMGENKVQEIRDKQAELADRAVPLVLIGHLQSNKAKDIARLA